VEAAGHGVSMSGRIEIFARRDRFLYVAGWFRAPPEGAPGSAPDELPRLALVWSGTRREVPLRLLRDRPDLPPTEVLGAGRGFQVLLQAPEADGPATALLLLGGDETPLLPAELRARPFLPRGGIDLQDRDGLGGWVLDAPGRRPVLLVDGAAAVPVALDRHRPDLPFDDGSDRPLFGFHVPQRALAEALRAARPGAALFDGRPHEVVLAASDVELGRYRFVFRRDVTGVLERAEDGRASGWIAEKGRPASRETVDLLLDGTRWATVPADLSRGDLVRHGLSETGGGFRATLPRYHPGEGGALRIAAVPQHGTEPLRGEAVLEGLPPPRRDRGAVSFRLPADGVPVTVVVPIHNAADDLDRCVATLVRHTTRPARLLLLDDASTQPAMEAVLGRWRGTPGVTIHRYPGNLGFTRTANRGIALAGRDDVVLLNSDTLVGPGWLDGLRVAARSGPRTGTATAVSDNAGAFSVPEYNLANGMPPWFGTDEMARLVRAGSAALFPAMPTGHGFCLYLRRDLLDAVGPLDEAAFPRGYGEENDLCMRAVRAGFENAVDDRTFVGHRRSASFGRERKGLMAAGRAVLDARYPEYGALAGTFETDPAMLTARWRLRRALEAARAEGAVPRPRVLFVISTESGGTPQTNADLMDALADRYEPWLLRCDSRVLTLSRHRPPASRGGGAGATEEVEAHRLDRPIEPATHRSGEYDHLVGDMVVRHGFELAHVRHLAWHGLGLIATLRRLGVPVVFSFHDFYAACPTVKLLDAEGRFCGGPCTAGEADCVPELWPARAVPPLRHRFVHRWQAMMGEALRDCDAFVTTSPSARGTLTANFPFLADRDFRIVPHGRSFARMEMLAAEPSLDEPLRVLVPGNVSAAKGGGLVAAVAALDRGREVEFHVLGGVDSSLAAEPGLVLHGRYDRADFAGHVARIRPHLGAVLSRWPETYCHTLTECWAAGLPVVATALGALAERVGADAGGWLLDPAGSPAELLALLRRLRRSPRELRERRDAVLDWQARTGRHHDSAAMAVEYDRLYREVLDRRLAFRTGAARPRVVLTLDGPGGALPSPLAAATRNAVSRPFIFRPVLPSFPFGDPSAGPADAVLVAPDALPPEDLAGLRRRCDAAGLPVLEAVPGDPGSVPEASARIPVGCGLEPSVWLSGDGPVPLAEAEAETPCRVLLVGDGDDAVLPLLRPVFEDLAALGVATLGVLGRPRAAGGWFQVLEEGEGGVAALRRAAAAHRLGIARPGPTMLALRAAGLPVLTIPPALTEGDPDRVAAAREILLRDIAELAVDAPRREALAKEARRVAQAALGAPAIAAALDARLARAIDRMSSAPAVPRLPAGRPTEPVPAEG